MNRKFLQKVRSLVPFLLVTFLVCGGGSLFCPMEGAAAEPHHAESDAHQLPSTPINSSDDCLDQLKISEEKSRDLTDGLLPIAVFIRSADIFDSTFSHYALSTSASPRTSTYPLLFLLFSVFLN